MSIWRGTALAVLVAALVSALGGASGIGGKEAGEKELLPTAIEKDKGESGEIKARAAWFYEQREYPADRTPPGALKKAREEAKQLVKAKSGSGATVANAALSWSAIGPHP